MADKKTLEDYLREHQEREQEEQPNQQGGIALEDFYAFLPTGQFIFVPTRSLWISSIIDRTLPKVGKIKASTHLIKTRAVQQMTWSPGDNLLIKDRFIHEGGWVPHSGAVCFNRYRPPLKIEGDPEGAEPWLALVRKVYPNDADHIVQWFAQRVQEPHVKTNHALVLGGTTCIGKDSMLKPVLHAVGQWNCASVSPVEVMGRFNSFLKSVILVISEARHLGEISRYAFYEHLKNITAAPPDVLRIDEKHLQESYIPNITGVVITTNHKTDGIFLPADDRRNMVAWSPINMTEFPDGYWNTYYNWLDNGGFENVAAFLKSHNLTNFDPKTPPPKTPAFYDIVGASASPEDAELADLLDEIGNPEATTLSRLLAAASGPVLEWLSDRKNRRAIPHRLERAGYVPARNPDANDGLWVINSRRQVVYVRSTLSVASQQQAARRYYQGTA